MRISSNCILAMACVLSLCAGCGSDSGGSISSKAAKGESAYAISGKVVSDRGTPVAQVVLTLSGDHSGTTTTDADGNYRFADLSNGDYIVSPSLAGYLFSPADLSVTLRGADGSGIDFVATATTAGLNMWTWVSGDSIINQAGAYGILGLAAGTNTPGARVDSAGWADSRDQLWLFGGFGYVGALPGYLNDLWKFDGTNWTWVSGDSQADQPGVYGVQGVAGDANKPGARAGSIGWVDDQDHLWLFGGYGYDGTAPGYLNDLWTFDGKTWTWVSGDSRADQPGAYGTPKVAAKSNVPGGRCNSVSWKDSRGNLWLFGGWGYDGSGAFGCLNDLWKFDGAVWTWISGDSSADQAGVYGTKGMAAGSNKPGARIGSVSWTDSRDNLWLFGGAGYDGAGAVGNLNDLWKFDGATWTWVSGDSSADQAGVYGTKGVAAGSNKPGARVGGMGWTDSLGNLWLFGGEGSTGTQASVFLNDLWRFDGAAWTWISGERTSDQAGVYGVRGTAADSNNPGARYDGIGWTDSKDTLWLFGGAGIDGTGALGDLNDLWKYEP